MSDVKIRIKNWGQFQSYKDRNPPWIRFHKRILDDYNYQQMSDASRAILPMLWLLAAEHDDPKSGLIECKLCEIAFRLRQTEQKIEKAMKELQAFDFIACNETVTDSLRFCYPETETETETETDIHNLVTEKPSKLKGLQPEDIPDALWQDFMKLRRSKKAPVTATVMKMLNKEADKANISLAKALEECCLRGWQSFKAEWYSGEEKKKGRRPDVYQGM